jgi:hypothetical protein
MTTHRLSNVMAAAALAVMLGATSAGAAESAVQAGFGYDAWNSNASPKTRGGQMYIPVRAETKGDDFSIAVVSGLARTRFEPGAGDTVYLTNPLDTKVVSSYGIFGKLPFDVLLGLDVNVPTGKTDLAAKDLPLLMDSELVTITSFGEGWNFNPSLTVAGEIGDWVAGVSTAYAVRGRYNVSKDAGLGDFDPGNVWTVAGAVQGHLAPAVGLRLFGSFANFGTERQATMPLVREGNFWLLGAETGWQGDRVKVALTLKGIYREKSAFQDAAGTLVRESDNSHGMEYRADLTGAYALTGATVLSATAQGLHVSANDYAEGSGRHTGARNKGTIGLAAARKLTDVLEGDLSVKGFVMKDEASEFPVALGDRTYRGVQSLARLTARF